MRNKFTLAILGVVLFVSPVSVRGEHRSGGPDAFVASPAGQVVETPDGAKGVALPSTYGKYGSFPLTLKDELKPGLYEASFTITAVAPDAPTIAFYLQAGTLDIPITHPQSCAAGQIKIVKASFMVTQPTRTLVFKKMDETSAVSVVLLKIEINPLQGITGYPRLNVYEQLLDAPAPWGLRSAAIRQKITEARTGYVSDFPRAENLLSQVGDWLDQRSSAIELFAQNDAIERAIRLFRPEEEAPYRKKMQPLLDRLRNGVEQANAEETNQATSLVQAQQQASVQNIERVLGGMFLPEKGTDIFTWIKAWGGETYEPTPWRVGQGGDSTSPLYTLCLADDGETFDLEHSWVTNAYRSPTKDIIFSVLTPLHVVDVKRGDVSANVNGLLSNAQLLIGNKDDGGKLVTITNRKTTNLRFPDTEFSGWVLLRGTGRSILFVTNCKPDGIVWAGSTLKFQCSKPAAVGMILLNGDVTKIQATRLGRFYGGLLMKQPVGCAQVQRGNAVEQRFEYITRPSDFVDSSETVTPVPPMLTLSRRPESALKVFTDLQIQTSPDGWDYGKGKDNLSYNLPRRRNTYVPGINVFLSNSDPDLYKNLRQSGCKLIRLACGAQIEWQDTDACKKALRENLEWISQSGGLKVGIDLHTKWIITQSGKDFSDPAILKEFVSRWKNIITWCKPYSKVIAWYDLLNEPMIFCEKEDVKPYWDFMRKAIAQLRPLAGGTPFLVEVSNMANPGGANFWEPLGDSNVVLGYHDYWPHMFTHQMTVEAGASWTPHTFYPSFMPDISWKIPSWRGDLPLYFWDRWKCDAISLPVIRQMILRNCRVDCGEYGVVGYAGNAAKRSGNLWLEHAFDRFQRMGISHTVWAASMNSGYVWNVPAFRETVLQRWKHNAEK